MTDDLREIKQSWHLLKALSYTTKPVYVFLLKHNKTNKTLINSIRSCCFNIRQNSFPLSTVEKQHLKKSIRTIEILSSSKEKHTVLLSNILKNYNLIQFILKVSFKFLTEIVDKID